MLIIDAQRWSWLYAVAHADVSGSSLAITPLNNAGVDRSKPDVSDAVDCRASELA
jgi:hypothetical protein